MHCLTASLHVSDSVSLFCPATGGEIAGQRWLTKLQLSCSLRGIVSPTKYALNLLNQILNIGLNTTIAYCILIVFNLQQLR